MVAGGVAFVASPAGAAPPSFEQCAAPFPAAELTDGQVVTGLTTAGRARGSAVDPETFSGTYVDTLESDDGDLLVFDLAGSRITKADGSVDAGVWSGISGSPVYAADGRLVGAVAYTFGSWESSTIAGVTPAADLYALLDHEEVEAPPEEVLLTARQKSTLMAAGVSSTEIGRGARRIPTVSAINLSDRFASGYASIAKRAGAPARDVAAGGSTVSEEVPIVAGGNLAVADSYGSIAAYGLGTASAVCDGDVVGFGHPMDFRTAQRTIHGARTAFIQPDGVGSFKMANLAAPQGALLHDGLAGITGRLARAVDSATITSSTTVGTAQRSYTSTVPNPDAVGEIAATHAFRDAVMAQDQIGGGEALLRWTVRGTSLDDGSPVVLNRTQRYSARHDLARRLGQDVAADVFALQDNDFSLVDIDEVTLDDTLNTTYKALKVSKVRYYDTAKKTWRTLSTSSALSVKRGTDLRLEITLSRADKYSKAKERTFERTVKISKYASGKGRLTVAGGFHAGWGDEDEDYADLAPWELDEDYFEEDTLTVPEQEPTSAQEVADLLQGQQTHDTVRISHDHDDKKAGLVNADIDARLSSVVGGSLTFRLSYR